MVLASRFDTAASPSFALLLAPLPVSMILWRPSNFPLRLGAFFPWLNLDLKLELKLILLGDNWRRQFLALLCLIINPALPRPQSARRSSLRKSLSRSLLWSCCFARLVDRFPLLYLAIIA
ncbi:hypothetical protein SCHPADRAFT_355061 [Schizopora paradoxa]|uniref:Uncharacterized protein n=1 Tax=Schizopora paradoxa TaxID=27342 RepID=A0A0H2RVW1_9AGAM|nr:hypothetical protein SCHPADRAFT_355061 [Schizopora paradoxa]